MDELDVKFKLNSYLNSYLNKYSINSFYLNFKFKIYYYLNIIKNDTELYNKLKEINEKILEPKQLLSKEINDRVSFFDSPNKDHKLFLPYKFWVKVFEEFKNKLDQSRYSYLVKLFQDLINGYQEFIDSFILEAKINGKSPKRMDMYNNDVYLVDEYQLEFREINLDKAYEISCYDQDKYEYIGTNSSGLSIGRKLSDCYFKVDNGNGLLSPANECAVYKFYSNIYGSDQKLISPTQLVLLSKIPILPPNLRDSPQRKKMENIKEKERFDSNEQVFIFDLQLKSQVNDARKIERTLSIQASKFINGPTIESFLNEIFTQNQDYSSKLLSSIDLYSFSCHILSSLILLPKDYKPDNLIIDITSKQIVGCDNDHCLEDDEMRKDKNSNSLIKIKNILYLLEPLMNKEIQNDARNQFLNKQCHHLLLDWLFYLFENEQNYEMLIKMSLFTNYLQLPDEIVFDQTKQTLNLPIKFQPGFITSLLLRFIRIQELLKENKNLTHQKLFNEIHPFASVYYDATKRVYPGNPLDQIASIYHNHGCDEKVQNYLYENSTTIYKDYFTNLTNHSFIQSDKSVSVKDSIIDFVNNLNVFDLFKDLNEVSFLEIIKLINKLSRNYRFRFHLHDSWRFFIQKTLRILMNQNADQIVIKEFIYLLKLTTTQINEDVLGEESSIINIILMLQISGDSKINYIKLFTSLGSSVNMVEDSQLSSLDLAVSLSKNKVDSIKLFKLLIELGAGKFCRDPIIVEFYNSLSRQDKEDLKDTINLLSKVNQKICWLLSLNHLFPVISNSISSSLSIASSSCSNNILYTTTAGNRVVTDEQWNKIFDNDGNPKKMNQFGTRSVVYLTDCGHGIYLKFEPQLPGTELAVSLLGQHLFGFCSPHSELAFLNGLPVLLVQEIKGDTLFNFMKKDPKKLLIINPESISRLLVLEILINNGDGNLANFILVETSSGNDEQVESYDIYSIDNDLAFIPPFAQEIKKGKLFPNIYLSLQVQSSLLLFEQMFDYVHRDVVKVLLNKNLIVELKNWVKALSEYHEKWVSFFSNQYIIENRKKSDSTIIGVSFVPGQIKSLYSKVVRLQNLIKKPISHFKLLESLEPMVAKRYREIFNKSPEINSVFIRCEILKQSKDENLLTSSFYLTEHILESRDIPNAERIKVELKFGRYGPDQALYEIIEIENQYSSFEQILKIIQTINVKQKYQPIIEISDAKLELALKESNFENLTNIQEQHLFKLIEGRSLLRIILRNSKELSNRYLNTFNFNNVTILNLSNSHNLESISNGIFIKSQIEMPFLKKLKLNNCTKLTELLITSKNLTQVFATNCRFKLFKLDGATELDTLYLSNNSIQNIDILYHLSNFKKLLFLDLSKNQLLNNINLLSYNIVSKKIIIDINNNSLNNRNSGSGNNSIKNNNFKSPFYYSSSSLSSSSSSSSSLASSSSSLSSSSSSTCKSPLSLSLSSSSSLSFPFEEDIESINILSFGSYLKNANLIGGILCNKDLINNRKPIGTSGGSIKIDDKFFLYFFIDENQSKTSLEFELVRARAIVMFFDPSLDDQNDYEQIKLSVSLLKKYYKLSLNAYGLSIPYLLLGATEQPSKKIPTSIQKFQEYYNIKLIYNTGIDTKEKQLGLRKEIYDYLDHYL